MSPYTVYRLMFTTKEPFRLLPEERTQLQQLLRSRRVSAELARRARVLLLLDEGRSVRQIQAQTGMSPRRTLHWKQRWRKSGLDGLLDVPRAGRPRKVTKKKEAASRVTVMRLWHKVGLQPHPLRHYMTSPDPDCEAKAKDILGLYLHLPEYAAVFCIDEKTSIVGSIPELFLFLLSYLF